MSDFLQFKDEVINGSPRYNISDNGDGTKSIELANEVVHQGTALNKANFEKLNAVLGYNELQYTTTEIIEGTNLVAGTYNCNHHDLISNSAGLEIYATTTSSSTRTLTVEYNQQQQKNAILFDNTTSYLEVKNITEFKVSLYSSGTGKFDGSNDLSTWTTIETYSGTRKVVTIQPNYKYYRISGSGTLSVYAFDFIGKTISINYIWESPINKNGQILKMVNTYQGESGGNKLNEKPIDTLLESGKYYELLYDEQNDRFIAYETRV